MLIRYLTVLILCSVQLPNSILTKLVVNPKLESNSFMSIGEDGNSIDNDFKFDIHNYSLRYEKGLSISSENCILNLDYKNEQTFGIKKHTGHEPNELTLNKGDEFLWVYHPTPHFFNLFESTNEEFCKEIKDVNINGLDEILVYLEELKSKYGDTIKEIENISDLTLEFLIVYDNDRIDWKQLMKLTREYDQLPFISAFEIVDNEMDNGNKINNSRMWELIEEDLEIWKITMITKMNEFCEIENRELSFFENMINFFSNLFSSNNENKNLDKLYSKDDIKKICDEKHLEELKNTKFNISDDRVKELDALITNYFKERAVQEKKRVTDFYNSCDINPVIYIFKQYNMSLYEKEEGQNSLTLEDIITMIYGYIQTTYPINISSIRQSKDFEEIMIYISTMMNEFKDKLFLNYENFVHKSLIYPNWFYDNIDQINKQISDKNSINIQNMFSDLELQEEIYQRNFIDTQKPIYENIEFFVEYDIYNGENDFDYMKFKRYLVYAGIHISLKHDLDKNVFPQIIEKKESLSI